MFLFQTGLQVYDSYDLDGFYNVDQWLFIRPVLAYCFRCVLGAQSRLAKIPVGRTYAENRALLEILNLQFGFTTSS